MTADFGLADLDIGPPIAKGCAAVVYAASITNPATATATTSATTTATNSNDQMTTTTLSAPTSPQAQFDPNATNSPQTSTPAAANPSLLMTPIQNTSRFVHNFGGSVDNLHAQRQRSYSTNGGNFIVDEYRRRSVTTTQLRRNRLNSTLLDESEFEREFNGIAAGDGGTENGNPVCRVKCSAYPILSTTCETGVIVRSQMVSSKRLAENSPL